MDPSELWYIPLSYGIHLLCTHVVATGITSLFTEVEVLGKGLETHPPSLSFSTHLLFRVALKTHSEQNEVPWEYSYKIIFPHLTWNALRSNLRASFLNP